MFTRFLIMHGLISYLLWDTLFIPFLIRLAFLGDRDGCLRPRGVASKSHDFHATATLIFEKLLEWMGKEEA
jgi:hypothetical protein